MNRRPLQRRLAVVSAIIGKQEIAPASVDRAYATFLRTGEVPDDQRLAWQVAKRALHARKAAADLEGGGWLDRDLGTPRVAGSPREVLFREAALGDGPPRECARLVMRMMVSDGADPTDLEFVPSHTAVPEYGSLALHALGWPDQWVRPEYEAQMRRVMEQHARLRERVARTEAWYREAGTALGAFLTNGVVPKDGALQAFVLTIGELFALHGHFFGRGSEELLAAFDAVAKAKGPQRQDALAHLGTVQAAWEVPS